MLLRWSMRLSPLEAVMMGLRPGRCLGAFAERTASSRMIPDSRYSAITRYML